jgi:hypothetical protein
MLVWAEPGDGEMHMGCLLWRVAGSSCKCDNLAPLHFSGDAAWCAIDLAGRKMRAIKCLYSELVKRMTQASIARLSQRRRWLRRRL